MMTIKYSHYQTEFSQLKQGIHITIGIVAFAFYSNALAGDYVPQKPRNLTAKEKLGQQLFFDTNLSTPAGQACASCHDTKAFFADPDKNLPTSEGVLPQLKGNRNTPSSLYAAFSPRFHFDSQEGLYLGGQFLDGRGCNANRASQRAFSQSSGNG